MQSPRNSSREAVDQPFRAPGAAGLLVRHAGERQAAGELARAGGAGRCRSRPRPRCRISCRRRRARAPCRPRSRRSRDRATRPRLAPTGKTSIWPFRTRCRPGRAALEAPDDVRAGGPWPRGPRPARPRPRSVATQEGGRGRACRPAGSGSGCATKPDRKRDERVAVLRRSRRGSGPWATSRAGPLPPRRRARSGATSCAIECECRLRHSPGYNPHRTASATQSASTAQASRKSSISMGSSGLWLPLLVAHEQHRGRHARGREGGGIVRGGAAERHGRDAEPLRGLASARRRSPDRPMPTGAAARAPEIEGDAPLRLDLADRAPACCSSSRRGRPDRRRARRG